MSTDLKTTNRGGKRTGAGRPTKAQQEAKTVTSSKADVLSAPIKVKVDGKNVKLDVITEIAKIYLELSNKTLDKDERKELLDRVSILEKLLPYSTSKKPIASTQDNTQEATKIKISGIDLEDL